MNLDNYTRGSLLDLIKNALNDLDDLLPKDNDIKSVNPLLWSEALGKAIGVKEILEALGENEDAELKDAIWVLSCSIAKGRGYLNCAVMERKDSQLALIEKSIKEIEEYAYLGRKYANPNLDFDFKNNKYDVTFAVALTHALSCALGVALSLSNDFLNPSDSEISDGLKLLTNVMAEHREISSKIVSCLPKRKTLKGRRKADAKTLMEIVKGDKLVYNKIVELNNAQKLYGAKVGYLFRALYDKGLLADKHMELKIFYDAISLEFGSIGDISTIRKPISLKNEQLTELQKRKIEELKALF